MLPRQICQLLLTVAVILPFGTRLQLAAACRQKTGGLGKTYQLCGFRRFADQRLDMGKRGGGIIAGTILQGGNCQAHINSAHAKERQDGRPIRAPSVRHNRRYAHHQ